MRFSEETEAALRQSGWQPGRSVAERVKEWQRDLSSFRSFGLAEGILSEFGGLRVEQDGPGLECARQDFELNPILAVGEEDRFSDYEEEIKSRLYPLGEALGGHAFLAVAEDGRIYVLMDEILLAGSGFDEALERLVRGKSLTPTAGGTR